MDKRNFYISFAFVLLLIIGGCSGPVEHTAPAVRDKDSLPMMVSYGVNTIISDSGVQKYRIVTERWEVNTALSRPMWRFAKGLFLSEFDDKFDVILSIQSDTAYYYNKERLWELRGRVRVRNSKGLHYTSEELYWDQDKRQFYSNVWSKVVTPERTLEGDRFVSDERMEKYHVWNTKGEFVKGDVMQGDSARGAMGGDSLPPVLQDNTSPYRKGSSAAQDTVKRSGTNP